MDRKLTDTMYPGFFPETLYSSQCAEISTHWTVANSWELGQCFLKGCVQTWALLLRSWVICFLCTTASELLEGTAQIPLQTKRTPSCWKCLQLTAGTLSRNCLLLKRANPSGPCFLPGYLTNIWFTGGQWGEGVLWKPGSLTPTHLAPTPDPSEGSPI